MDERPCSGIALQTGASVLERSLWNGALTLGIAGLGVLFMPLMITDVCLERVLGIERLHGEWLVVVCCDVAADDH